MKNLPVQIRILFVEDVARDAEIVNKALLENGLNFYLHRVDTREGFLSELRENPPDVILSDHGLPDFSGFAALAYARERLPDVPFIFVTNALTPEMEIEKIAPGVTDLVPKSDLPRLGPMIRRALTEPAPRRVLTEKERQQVIHKLLGLLASYEIEGIYIPVCAGCKKIRDKDGKWHAPEVYFSDHLELKFTHSICPDCQPEFLQ